MKLTIQCQCGKRYSVASEHAGKALKCAACGARVTVPSAPDTSPPVVPTRRERSARPAAAPEPVRSKAMRIGGAIAAVVATVAVIMIIMAGQSGTSNTPLSTAGSNKPISVQKDGEASKSQSTSPLVRHAGAPLELMTPAPKDPLADPAPPAEVWGKRGAFDLGFKDVPIDACTPRPEGELQPGWTITRIQTTTSFRFSDDIMPHYGLIASSRQSPIFEVAGGRKLGEFVHDDADGRSPRWSAISPDGLVFARQSADVGSKIEIFSTLTGERRHPFSPPRESIAAAFISSHRLVVHLDLFEGKRELVMYELRGEPVEIGRISPFDGKFSAWSANRKLLASMGTRDELSIYDMVAGYLVAQKKNWNAPRTHRVQAMAFSNDGRTVGALIEGSSSQRYVRELDLTNGQMSDVPLLAMQGMAEFRSASFHYMPDDQSWLLDGNQVIDRATGRFLLQIVPPGGRAGSISTVRPVSQNHAVFERHFSQRVDGEHGQDLNFVELSLEKIPWDAIAAARASMAAKLPDQGGKTIAKTPDPVKPKPTPSLPTPAPPVSSPKPGDNDRSIAWQYTPRLIDLAVPAPALKARTWKLVTPVTNIVRVQALGAAGEQAMLYCRESLGRGMLGSRRASDFRWWVEHAVPAAGGAGTGTKFTLPEGAIPLDATNDGQHVGIIHTATTKAMEFTVLPLDEAERGNAITFKPFETTGRKSSDLGLGLSGDDRGIHHAAFAEDDRVILINGSQRNASVWNWRKPAQLWTQKQAGKLLAIAPGGDAFATQMDLRHVHLIATDTGAVLGEIHLPIAGMQVPSVRGAFHPRGDRIALHLADDLENRVVIADLNTGQIKQSLDLPKPAPNASQFGPRMRWLGDDHLLIDGMLVHLPASRVVWRYNMSSLAAWDMTGSGTELWGLATEGKTSTLVVASQPDDTVMRAIQTAPPPPRALFTRDTPLRLDIDCPGDIPDAVAKLTEALNARGFKIDPAAKATLMIRSAVTPTGKQNSYLARRSGERFEIDENRITVQSTLSNAQGELAWSDKLEYLAGAGEDIRLDNREEYVLELGRRWVAQAHGYVTTLRIPGSVHAPGNWFAGETTFTPMGMKHKLK